MRAPAPSIVVGRERGCRRGTPRTHREYGSTQCVYFRTMPPYDSDIREATTGDRAGAAGRVVGRRRRPWAVAWCWLYRRANRQQLEPLTVQVASRRVTVDRTFGW